MMRSQILRHQNQNRLHLFTSQQRLTEDWGKKNPSICGLQSKSDVEDKGNKYCNLSEPIELSFEAKSERLHSHRIFRQV